MDELEALLAQLGTFFGGSAPVAGPPTPPAMLAGPGGTMTGTPSAPGAPGSPGTPGALSSLASGAGASGINLQTILQLITAMGGANMSTEQINMLKQLYAQQQRAAQIAMNPAALARRTANATLPINRELAYTVNSAADANSANMGMSQAPGAVAGARAAALAPYAQRNLEMGNQMAEFGLPGGGFGAPNPPDLLSILKQLNQFGTSTGGGGGTYSLPAGIV